MLPQYYPPHGTVYYHFRKWSESTKLVVFLRRLVAEGRRKTGRKPRPTVAVIDSQSVRSGYARSQKGVDGFRKVKGIKRQILVDSNGFPLLAEVTTANVHDSKGASILLTAREMTYLAAILFMHRHC